MATPARVASLARRVPEATIVALGALSSLQHEFELRRLAAEAPNLLFDTTVTLPIGPEALWLIDQQMTRRVEPGDFEILVGTSSETTLKATLTVK